MNLQRMKRLAGILTEGVMAVPGIGATVDEKAPPGMEHMVRQLKKEYPGHEEKAFATAWSIYNKKHGKKEECAMNMEESVPAIDSCRQTNPADADIACAMEEGMPELNYNQQMERMRGLLNSYVEPQEAFDIISREMDEQGFEANEIDEIMAALEDEFFPDDSAFDHMGGSDDMSDDADALASAGHGSDEDYGGENFEFDESDNTESRHGNALRKLETLTRRSGYRDGEIAAETGNEAGGDMESALELFHAYLDAHPELQGQEPVGEGGLSDRMVNAYQEGYQEGYSGLEEAFNLQNGYDDINDAEGKDYFPNGADSPVVKTTGASGARHGDNPEQKKMAVAETHKELVYKYRDFLKESARK
jgi:hypothetical protein